MVLPKPMLTQFPQQVVILRPLLELPRLEPILHWLLVLRQPLMVFLLPRMIVSWSKIRRLGRKTGLYLVQTLGTGANGTWVRTTDADTSAKVFSGLSIKVNEGTINADSQWVLTTNATITLGTTALTFSRPGSAGVDSTALGVGSLRFSTASNNTAVGRDALALCVSGGANTAVGNKALEDVVSGTNNTAVGHLALANTTTSGATGVGFNALGSNTTGTQNTAVGNNAATTSTTAANITAVGATALQVNTAADNTAVGAAALTANTSGTRNTSLGARAAAVNITGNDITAVGYLAAEDATGSDATAVGSSALANLTTGAGNTAVGARALDANLTGAGNTAVGTDALGAATGASNTAVGRSAGLSVSTGANNTLIGDLAGDALTTSSDVTAVGSNAAGANTAADTTAVGSAALAANTTGTGNTAVGARALDANVTANNNTAVGTNALGATTAASNTGVGFNALALNNTGTQNTAVGNLAVSSNTVGSQNTGVGHAAINNTTGTNNSALGNSAGNSLTSGSNNTFIGSLANTNSATGTNRTAIGYNASVTADNSVQLGDVNVTLVNTSGAYSGTRYTSTVATGTAPLTVASTTLVTNLNADLLDGLNTASANTASTVMTRDANGRSQVSDPAADLDIANKQYVDSVASGLDVKASVRVKTTGANITLAGGAPNTLDGVTLAANDRILVTDQTTASQNGIYFVQTLGTGATGTWVRTTDADTSTEVTAGMFTFVVEGTTHADSGWILTTNDAITLGTTALTFTQFSGAGQITAGAGLTKTGNTIDVVAADGSITVNADSITVGLVPISKGGTNGTTAQAARTNLVVPSFFAASHGDGAAFTYTLTHNLGTLDVLVNVYRVSDGVEVMPDITRSTTNAVIVGYAVAPTANQYRAVVHGGV